MVMAGADGNAETVSRQWVTRRHLRRARRQRRSPAARSPPRTTPGAPNVVVLSEAFWRDALQRRSRASSAARSGSTATLWTVVGVVPGELSAARADQHLGDACRSSTCRRARAAPTSCRSSAALKPGVTDRGGQRRPRRPSPTGSRASSPTTNKGRGVSARAAARRPDRQRSAARRRCCSSASSASCC